MPDPTWSLAVHGGSGGMRRGVLSPEVDARARAGLGYALEAGGAILGRGGSALDAVEAAVRVLEDDLHFNAGRGAALSREGCAELDAAIMDGRTRAAGAVARVTMSRSPVVLARAVMEQSAHVFLAGIGADAFSREIGVEQVANDWFVTPTRRAQLAELLEKGGDGFDVEMKYGTVGAVARDAHGHLAAATSTGGVTGKRWGRIGDSPIIGAGTWADDRSCAVSCTGAGEYFLRAGAAHEIDARIRLAGETLAEAVAAVLADVQSLGGTGGVIAASPSGEIDWQFTTAGMYRGRATAGGTSVAIYGDEA